MQPNSIRKFTLFYFASLLVTLAATLTDFEGWLAAAEAQAGSRLAFEVLIVCIVLGTAILLLLWYLVARKGLGIAKWAFVLYFLFNLVSAYDNFAGRLAIVEGAVLLALALQAAAAFYLFQPDAKAWFAGERAADAPREG